MVVNLGEELKTKKNTWDKPLSFTPSHNNHNSKEVA